MKKKNYKAEVILQFIIVVIVLIFTARVTQAAPILDQYYAPETTNYSNGAYEKAQTFTVGITGMLDSVDVYIDRGAGIESDLLFDIRGTTDGVPNDDNENTLVSVTVPYDTVPTTLGFFSIDISSYGLSVTEGDVLAIVLRSLPKSASDYTWYGTYTPPDGYANGDYYVRHTLTYWTAPDSGNDDMVFRTYVEPTFTISGHVYESSGSTAVSGNTINVEAIQGEACGYYYVVDPTTVNMTTGAYSLTLPEGDYYLKINNNNPEFRKVCDKSSNKK